MNTLQKKYSEMRTCLAERVARQPAFQEFTREAMAVAGRFHILQKRRAASEYTDLATYLMTTYSPEVAYFIAVAIDHRFAARLGYPPIGQIMVALEHIDGEWPASWIRCALLNFPRIETAQLAFGVIKSTNMRALVRAHLASESREVAEYICGADWEDAPVTHTPASQNLQIDVTDAVTDDSRLSDGIRNMPRPLTTAELKGDRLFLHLQALSVVLLILPPVLGGVAAGLLGAAAGMIIGLVVFVSFRRSMGIRGRDANTAFFIRMRERADGSRRGLLETLIERVRGRTFTREQCADIADEWDDFQRRLPQATSAAERRRLLEEFDSVVKRISYGTRATGK